MVSYVHRNLATFHLAPILLKSYSLQAFNMIDQNHDGFICKEDLHDMLASLGKF